MIEQNTLTEAVKKAARQAAVEKSGEARKETAFGKETAAPGK